MRRAGFGAKPEEVDAMLALGVHRVLDLLLTSSSSTLPDSGAIVLPHGELCDIGFSLNGQRAQWLYEMAHTIHPLSEKMVLFWSDHFSVGAESGNQTPLLPAHINLFRRHGLGSFRQMLVEVTKDPAMMEAFQEYCKRMRKTKAIIKIARKLLNRIRYVLKNQAIEL